MEILKGFVFDLQLHAEKLYKEIGGSAPDGGTSLDFNTFNNVRPTDGNTNWWAIATVNDAGVVTGVQYRKYTGDGWSSAEAENFTGTLTDGVIDLGAYKKFAGTRSYRLQFTRSTGVEIGDVSVGDIFILRMMGWTLKVGTSTTYTAGTSGARFMGRIIGTGAETAEAVLIGGSIVAATSADVASVTVHVDGAVGNGAVTLEPVTSGEAVTAEITPAKATSILKGSKLTTTVSKYDFETGNLKYTAVKAGETGDESWDSVTIDGKTFNSGDTAGGSLTISKDGDNYAVTSGTIYLGAGENAKVKVGNSEAQTVTAGTGTDITVQVTNANVIVGDVDDGDSFTIGTTTYTVENGVLKKGGTPVEGVRTLTSGNAFAITFTSDGAYNSADPVANANKSGASTTPVEPNTDSATQATINLSGINGTTMWKYGAGAWDQVDPAPESGIGYLTYDATTRAFTYTQNGGVAGPVTVNVTTSNKSLDLGATHNGVTYGKITVSDGGTVSGATISADIEIAGASQIGSAINNVLIKNSANEAKAVTIHDGDNIPQLATDLSTKLSNNKVYTANGELVSGYCIVTESTISEIKSNTTIGSWTYSMNDGKLTAISSSSEKKTYSSVTSFDGVTITAAGGDTGIDTVMKGGSPVNPDGSSSEEKKDVTGINFVVSGGGLLAAATVKEFSNNDYLHKDGTVGSSSTDAVGQFKYNSTTGVITYTPTDKTKAQTIDFSSDESSYKFNVSGTNAADTITGKDGEHTINGGSGNDTITAGASNTVIGGAGNDSIVGATKASLNGGAGNDTLRGGAETTLVGSDGADTFVLSDGTNTGAGFISDYKLDQNDVILAANIANQADLRNAAKTATNFGVTGALTFGTGSGTVTLDGSKGYYAVNVKANDGKTQIFGWAGEKATKIDASSLKDDVILLGNTNSEADSLYGGSGDDTIFAGAGDTVYGAAGKNLITLVGSSGDDATNTVGVGKGKDTIQGFVASFDSEKADKLTIVGGLSSIGSTLASGGTLDLKSGDASVHMTGLSTASSGGTEVLVNGKKAVFAADGATVSVSSATYADYYLGTKGTSGGSILDASAIEESVSIDLSNTNVFRNFNQVTGGKGKTTLIGTSGNDTLIAGEGTTSLYGGAGKDSLVGSSSTEVRDTFFMMAGAGSDSISGFTVFNGENADTADIVNFSAIQSAKHVTGGAQINVNDTDKVLIENVNVDDAIGYQVGNSINAAKLGDVSNENNFTYLNGVNYYGGGNKVDTVAFTSGDSDNHEIWLDGSKGVSYASIDVVDGSNASGDLILAGDSAKNTIVGGAGSSSLWGGAGNTADVLTGNGSKNTFFYGLAEGNDTITCGSENDLVNLYNIGLSDVSKAEITDSGVSLEFIDGSKVSVDTGYRDVKFALKDGSTWTANHNTHQWNS